MDITNVNTDQSSDKINSSISLELGDIIEIISPSNVALHESSVFIKYIDNQQIQVINIASLTETQLNIDETGILTDESIIQINLLSRSEEKGYARQNNLLPHTWVNIHIGGDLPALITGEITNLEEDMIEIIRYPELKTIFIDFKYQGIPTYIPLDKIVIRDKPTSLKSGISLSSIKEGLEEGEEYEMPDEELASIEFNDNGESIINIPESIDKDPNIKEVLREIYTDADTISFDEDLGEVRQNIEISEREQRYGINMQVNDMMDELLSTIPNSERTELVMNNIHNLIHKYKLLRQIYSKFDNNQDIYDVKMVGKYYKPIIQHIMKMNTRLQWLLPVVQIKKKVYDVTNGADIEDIYVENTADSLKNIQNIQNDYYERNVNGSKDYTLMQQRIQEIMNPINDNVSGNFIYNTQILTDIDAIIDNLDDFNSTVYTKAGLSRRQYVIQRYNLGLNKLDNNQLKGGKTVYTRSSMTPNDTIHLKSLMVLPAPIVKFSAVHLPSTSLLNRVSLHQEYFMLFRALRKNTEIIPHIIDNFDNEFNYEQMQTDTKQTLLNGIHEFILGDIEHIDNTERFEKFLETFIPHTNTLLQLFHKHMTSKLSMVSIVQQLEPFMIYTEEITYTQYNEIRKFINTEIEKLKKNIRENIPQFDKLKNYKYNIISKQNIILRLLAEKKDIADSFFQIYNLIHPDDKNIQNLSQHEMLHRMILTDTGTLYMNAISSLLVSLNTPTNIMQSLNEPTVDDMSDIEKIKPTDCTTRVLSKKYNSLKDLQKDNNVDVIYFDKEYDNTSYNILDKYKDQQTKLEPGLFLDFLIENLIQRHDCPSDLAPELAKTIISKQKEVINGNYAILEIKPTLKEGFDESKMNESEKESIKMESDIRKKVYFYRRLNDNWIIDDDVSQNSFIDSQSLICNISDPCLYSDKHKICDSKDNTRIRVNEHNEQEIKNELEKRYIESVEDFEKELENQIAHQIKYLKRKMMLREVQDYKANNLSYEIGKQTTTTSSIISPNEKLKRLIMGHEDFIKKQTYICKFVQIYTREPMIEQLNESPHWYYCKDTNVKLFPVSIYELANTFVSGGNYQDKQDELCVKLGVMSDNGDAIVCKYSGEVLRKIDFSTEEGFDEAGFRITSHAIMEKDLGDSYTDMDTKTSIVFENENSEKIYNIANTLLTRINIPFDNMKSFILRISNDVIDNNMLSESAYARRNELAIKENDKSLAPYINYKDEIIIMIVSAIVLVCIQTATPSFVISRVFPGCVKSFTGYPLTGIEDTSGIQYLACVISKVKSSIKPWNSIQKLNVDKISNRIITVLQGYIVKRSDVDELYINKRLFLTLNPDNVIPKEHNISNWHHFMPPVTPYSVIKSLRPVSNDFKNELLSTIKNGNSSQSNMISLLNSRITSFGYGIIELINKIVKKTDLLLKTSSEIPFLENACCNNLEVNLIKPILYFYEQDSNIKVLLQKVGSMVKFQRSIQNITNCPFFYHSVSTRLNHPELPSGRLEENIYAAVIHYCNLDKDLPIPDDLTVFYPEKLPDYKTSWSLLEKIEFMKRNGKQFNIETLYNLMYVINNRNLVSIDNTDAVNIVDGLKDFIEYLDINDSTIFDSRIREHLRNVINQYNPKQMNDVFTPELNDLSDYLTVCNQRMYKKIMVFFDDFGNLSNRNYDHLQNFLSNVSKWNIDTPNNKENIYDNGLYTVTNFLQNAIVMFSKVYPELLLNNETPYMAIPKHWGLAEDHVSDIDSILHKQFSGMEAFRDDKILSGILQRVSIENVDLNIFLKLIPIQTDIQREIINENEEKEIISFYSLFGKQTIYLLFTHCFYLLLCNYINLSDEPTIIHTNTQLSKSLRREHNELVNDSSLHIAAISQTTDETPENNLTEIQIRTDTHNIALKSRVASLLYALIKSEMNNKKETNYTYDDIIKKVNMAKEREKQSFIEYLGVDNMSDECRKAEVLMKKYRLGKWNVGKQRGLIHYDKDTYTRERNEMLSQLNEDVTANVHNVVNEMRREIYDIEQDNDMEATTQEDMEAMDIHGLDDDYNDGVYYEEDREPENY